VAPKNLGAKDKEDRCDSKQQGDGNWCLKDREMGLEIFFHVVVP
jgi:hypothetical protein